MSSRLGRATLSIAVALVLVQRAPVLADDRARAELGTESEAEAYQAARAAFDEGRIAFESGRFEIALERFERAYALNPRPELLFDIGLAADRLREDSRALEAFERYLREGEDPELRLEVEQRVSALRAAQSRDRWQERAQERARELERQGITPHTQPVAPTPSQTAAAAHGAGTPRWVSGNDAHARVDDDDGLLSQWWFWAGAAVLVAGGATTAYLLTRPDERAALPAPGTGVIVTTLRVAP